MASGTPVLLDYVDDFGERETLVVRDLQLVRSDAVGGYVDGDPEGHLFTLDGIRGVTPLPDQLW
ncbi:hypothetical protein [Motilibacter deserti]|uniref:Uncharacterized protein n=1 Tax=Motilibacter deserti TaxID=2714956 RepID=A0ABX0GSC9_9ACTN|nr:hypothetical protein [Motilibacter deserti]NHC13672.1 hypothetical protein [Motilibacter deserti]